MDDTTINIATVNPFRYRGYYYDTDTGLYYLQSRYYDPSIGRFLNADTTEVITYPTPSITTNLFAYCSNDPIDETDQGGNLVLSILKKILFGLLKGLFKQFCIDLVEWAFKKYICGSNVNFKPSPAEDYISSIISKIVDEFKLNQKAVIAVGIINLLVKYLPKLTGRRMKQADWLNLLLDVVALVLGIILKDSLKKLEGKRSRIKKKREKNSRNTTIKVAVKALNMKIKYAGISIDIVLPISQQLISSMINILC